VAQIDDASAAASTFALTYGCGYGLTKHAAVRLDVYKWTGSSWAVCHGTDWKYGATSTDQLGPRALEVVLGGPAACGPGYYGTLAYSYVMDNYGTWRGGSVWSGYEWVP
jgi:hypothetical protein